MKRLFQERKIIKTVEVELAAVKSHLKFEIANMNSKIESMWSSFVLSLNNNIELNNKIEYLSCK